MIGCGRFGPETSVFVKIDIEGGEFALLPSLGPLLEAPATEVLVSLHPAILAEGTGAAPAQVRTAIAQALAVFAGWAGAAIAEAGPVAAVPDAAAILDGRQPLDWWFRKPSPAK
jgi:hypothetical protein